MASADAPSITVRDLLGTSLGAMGRNAGSLILIAGLGLLPGVLLATLSTIASVQNVRAAERLRSERPVLF